MKPDSETIRKFKEIYEEEFNEKISDEVAFDRFSRLVNFLRIVIYGRLDIPKGGDILGPEKKL